MSVEPNMQTKYDKSVDAAYITLGEKVNPGDITYTYGCDPLELKGAQIHLDFSENFVLRGIEILDASKHLPREILDKSE